MWKNIISKLADSNEFKLTKEKDALKVTVADKAVLDKLKANLASQMSTLGLLQGQIVEPETGPRTVASITSAADKIPLKQTDKINPKDVFDRLFKEDLTGLTLSSTTGKIEWDDTASTKQVLRSKSTALTKRKLPVWKTQVQALQLLLATSDLIRLRSAFSTWAMPVSKDDDEAGPLAGVASTIIGAHEESKDGTSKKINASIFFDCGRLLSYLTVSTQRVKDDPLSIIIPKQNLIDYLAATLPQSLAMTSAKEKPIIAEPLKDGASKIPHDFHLIIDASGSMGDLSPYFNQISDVVDKIAEKSPDQLMHPSIFSAVSKTLSTLPASDAQLRNQLLAEKDKFSGGTRLDGTILDVLNTVDDATKISERHTTVMIFTDGADGLSTFQERTELSERIDAYKDQSNPPHFIFVKIGAHVDHEFFKRFADNTCATTIDLTSGNNLDPILARIDQVAASYGDIREFLDKEQKLLKVVRPVQGALTQVDIDLPTDDFSYGRRGFAPTHFVTPSAKSLQAIIKQQDALQEEVTRPASGYTTM